MLKNARSQWRRTPVLARSLGTLLLYLLQLCPLRGMPLASFLRDSALYRNKEWPGLVALLSLSLSLSFSLSSLMDTKNLPWRQERVPLGTDFPGPVPSQPAMSLWKKCGFVQRC
jgi:hypothetical protein